MNDYLKYSDIYSRFWFMHLGFDFQDRQTGRILTKGEFYRLCTDIAEGLTEGATLPERFRLVPRETAEKTVRRHGKVYEHEIL